jgi:hypothetical protein
MRSIIDSAGRGLFLALAASAVFLGPSGHAVSAPPVTAATLSAVVGQGQYGTIKGRLVWGGDQIPPVKVLEEKGKAEKEPEVCAATQPILSRELVVDPQNKGVAYAFAYVVKPKGTNPEAIKELLAKQPKLELDQKNCEFVPYLLPMHQDQTLVVTSSDPTNHNVHTNPFSNQAVNQTVARGSQLEMKLVAERLPIQVKCDIHPWMKSYVMVFDHPFFTTTGKDGAFEIKGVPAGTQNLVIWKEIVGYVNPGAGRGMPVTVTPGQVTDVGEIKLDPAKVKPAS